MRYANRHPRVLVLGLMAAAALTNPGCTCRQETAAERAAREEREAEQAEERRRKQQKSKKKPPLEVQAAVPQPGEPEVASLYVKPGHWMVARQAMKPNYEDWVGAATLQVVDGDGQPIPIARTSFALRSERGVALSKGQQKTIESVFFVPAQRGQLRCRSTVRRRGANLAGPPRLLKLRSMAPHQQHLVVVGKDAQRYRFLRSTLAVRAPLPVLLRPDDQPYAVPLDLQFRVVLVDGRDRLALPENPLCWTSVAYLLWDEIDPERLTPAQRVALVDWLHWGGQLLINGPDSLDLLRESFLDAYLPADGLGARRITASDVRPLSQAWAASRRSAPVPIDGAWSGVELRQRPEAEPIPGAGGLLAERRVGRGRVLISGVQLAERDLLNWEDGFESVLNGLVLRRPPRSFVYVADAFSSFGEARPQVAVVRPEGADSAGGNTRLRYFARDTHDADDAYRYQIVRGQDQFDGAVVRPPAAAAGPAAWSDFNAVATAARRVLRQAAGVDVPGAGFVVACLATYLAVLAPLNFLFFKALGRVELAWVAAPLIAVAATWVIVRQAQLDIGFVRAQTEVAILETQPQHPRGHLTRYLSFYTSLSTTYDLEFNEPTAVAAPFARREDFTPRPGDRPSIVGYQRLERARLSGLTVSSNSTDMAHSEEMFDLGGVLRWDAARRKLINETGYDLDALAVVRRPPTGSGYAAPLLGCWLGELPGRSSASVAMRPLAVGGGRVAFAEERSAAVPGAARVGGRDAPPAEQRLDFEPLFALALDPRRLAPGEVRAVGRLRRVLPGVAATPAASQLRGDTLLVAHLEYGPLPPPQKDANAPIDVLPRR